MPLMRIVGQSPPWHRNRGPVFSRRRVLNQAASQSNKESAHPLRKLVSSVLENVQKSLKIWGVTTAGIGLLALIALIVAIVK